MTTSTSVGSALPDPPLTPKATATRERLLELSARLFIDRGYDAVSLRDIAQEAGVTKGAIYGHFRSKGQLLVEVIRTRLADRDDLLDFDHPSARPKVMLDGFISPRGRELRLLQIDAAAAARHDADVAAGMAELDDVRSARMLDSLSRAADPETILFVIHALSDGIGVQEVHEREVPDAEAWRRTVGAMFAAALRVARP
jgi:AcrR family transcriptional regulator